MARARRNPDDEVLIANDSGVWVDSDGVEHPFTKGVTRVRASHPLARAMPSAFEQITVHYDVERTTAAPGERRGG